MRLGLLAGLFPNDNEVGLFDRTHLHFYTRQTVERLFEDAGYALGRLARQEKVILPGFAADLTESRRKNSPPLTCTVVAVAAA